MTWLHLATGLVMMVLGAAHAHDGEIIMAMLYALTGALFVAMYVADALGSYKE